MVKSPAKKPRSSKAATAGKPARAPKKPAAAKPRKPTKKPVAKKATKKAAAAKPARARKKPAKPAAAAHTGLRAFAAACDMGHVVHAFRADLDAIVGVVKTQAEFVAHVRGVGASALGQASGLRLGEQARATFLVELEGSPWRLWYAATNWLRPADSRLARLAGRVAERLAVRAISVTASDEAGEIRVFDEGELVDEFEDTFGPDVDALFADAELTIPPALIGDDPAALFLDDAALARVSRVDRLELRAVEGKKKRVKNPFTGQLMEVDSD